VKSDLALFDNISLHLVKHMLKNPLTLYKMICGNLECQTQNRNI